jgi:hypothetical protein
MGIRTCSDRSVISALSLPVVSVRLLSFKTIPYTLTREDSMLKFIA